MEEEKIQLMKNTWRIIIGYSERAGDVFYSYLFEEAPQLRVLFGEDIKKQNKKLLSMITLIITKLDRLDQVEQEIHYLAKKHKTYGVTEKDFQVFGNAFLKMLAEVIGTQWDKEAQEVWEEVYHRMAQAMLKEMNTG